MSYQPGTHIIASLQAAEPGLLLLHQGFREKINELIETHQLQKLGEVYHDFTPAGFTGVICLSESHISIHTWPEQQYLTFDVFLSNYLRDNRVTTHAIYQAIQEFFQAKVVFEQIITR